LAGIEIFLVRLDDNAVEHVFAVGNELRGAARTEQSHHSGDEYVVAVLQLSPIFVGKGIKKQSNNQLVR
jgi:hypothetical protein